MENKINERPKISIPKFFRVRNYNKCKEWDPHLWLEAFDYRVRLVQSWNSFLRNELESSDPDKNHVKFRECAEELLTNPTGRRSLFGYSKPTLIRDITARSLFDTELDDAMLGSLWFERYKKWKDISYINRYYFRESDLVKDFEETPSWVVMKDVYGAANWAGLEVNMNCSDEEIKTAFSDWLRKTRSAMSIGNPKKIIDGKTLQGWCDDRVLPCFDLLIYEEFFGVRFKQSEFYRALFDYLPRPQSDVDNSEKLRKTFIPRSMRVVSEATVISLNSQLKSSDPNFEKYQSSWPDIPEDIFRKVRT